MILGDVRNLHANDQLDIISTKMSGIPWSKSPQDESLSALICRKSADKMQMQENFSLAI